MPFPFWIKVRRISSSTSANFAQFQDQLAIKIGVELGLQPFLRQLLPHMVNSYPFDLVIGSSHMVNGEDPYYPEYLSGKTEGDR